MATALDDEQEGLTMKENFLAFMEREVRPRTRQPPNSAANISKRSQATSFQPFARSICCRRRRTTSMRRWKPVSAHACSSLQTCVRGLRSAVPLALRVQCSTATSTG